MRLAIAVAGVLLFLRLPGHAAQDLTGGLDIEVRAAGTAVENADVIVRGVTYRTDAAGRVAVTSAPGTFDITVVKSGFLPATAPVRLAPGIRQNILVELQPQPTVEEHVTV